MSNRIVRAHKLGKYNIKIPDMDSSMLLTDESTSICPNTQLPNIEGIYTSVTTDILLLTTTADVLEEVYKFPEMNIYMFQTKNVIYVEMMILIIMHILLRLQ